MKLHLSMDLNYDIQIGVRSLKSQIYLTFLLLMDISYMISKIKIITEPLIDNLEEDNQLLIYQ